MSQKFVTLRQMKSGMGALGALSLGISIPGATVSPEVQELLNSKPIQKIARRRTVVLKATAKMASGELTRRLRVLSRRRLKMALRQSPATI